MQTQKTYVLTPRYRLTKFIKMHQMGMMPSIIDVVPVINEVFVDTELSFEDLKHLVSVYTSDEVTIREVVEYNDNYTYPNG